MRNWVRLFVSSSGTIGLRTFWHGCIVVAFVDLMLLSMCAISAWFALSLLLTAYSVVCIYRKRLRDMGRPVVLLAIPLGMVTIGLGLLAAYNMTPQNQLLGLATFVGVVIAVVGVVSLVVLTAWIGLAPSRRQVGPATVFD